MNDMRLRPEADRLGAGMRGCIPAPRQNRFDARPVRTQTSWLMEYPAILRDGADAIARGVVPTRQATGGIADHICEDRKTT